jgi:hypothetical protein
VASQTLFLAVCFVSRKYLVVGLCFVCSPLFNHRFSFFSISSPFAFLLLGMSRVSFQTETVVHVNILIPAYQITTIEGVSRSDLARKLDVDVDDVVILPSAKKESSESDVHIALQSGVKFQSCKSIPTLLILHLADTVGDLLRYKQENEELSETLDRTAESLQGNRHLFSTFGML